MVMPFYEGITLKQELMGRTTAAEEAWLKQLLAPVMEALELLHSAQVYHRDIAPDNILLLADGRPVLLDLGAARRVIGDMTQALTVILKPGYAPIEQYADDPGMKQGAWTDIYALAAVIYLSVVGKTPIPSVGRIMKDSLTPAAEAAAGRCSEGFLKAVDRGLAVRPEDRPQTINEFRTLLGISGEPASPRAAAARPAAAPSSAEPRGRSRAPLLAAAVVVVLAAIAGGGYLMLGGEGTPPQDLPPSAPDAPATEPAPVAAPAQPPSAGPVPGRMETVVNDEDGQHRVTIDTDAQGRQVITTHDADGKTQTIRMTPQGVPEALPGVPAAAAFDPVDELDRIFQGRSKDFGVSVELARARVRIGRDKLSFRLRSTRPGYLYILMVGTDNEHFYQLFPNAIDANNRVAADATVSLPRPGWTMVAGGPAGINHFLAFVSAEERDFTQAGLKKVDPFAEFPLDEAARIASQSRAAGAAPSPFLGAAVCSDGSCSEDYGAAIFTIEEY
jgi:hypothetical protein